MLDATTNAKPVNEAATQWTDAIVERLKQMAEIVPAMSFARIAEALNDEFGTTFTRNSVIGKFHRLGCKAKETAQPEPRKTKQSSRRRNRTQEKLELNWSGTGRFVEDTSFRCTLMELDHPEMRKKCRFMPPETQDVYCGAPTSGKGISFCAFHYDICYKPTPQY